MQNSGMIIAGKYELGKEIGKGGMSRVYLATDTRLNKVWAVKKVDKTSSNPNKDLIIKSLRKEVKIMEGLNHPTITRIVDIIEDTKNIYIVMDYVEGEGLDKILKIKGRQNEDDVVHWAKQMCEVLIYLHNLPNPVVHRDIKPANIILQPGALNSIKIFDFGIAEKITKENSRNMQKVGTPGYWAPEQQVTGVPYDIRSDIYSLGATMHHLLTGRIPKDGREFIRLRAVTGRVSENTEGLEYVINKCLNKDPSKRYQNCEELLYDLNNLDKLSGDYRRQLKNKIIKFSVTAILCAVFALTSVFSNFGYTVLARQNQSLYAENIYEASNEIIDSYNSNSNDFVTILEKMKDIEENLETSRELSDDRYSNALAFTAYSVSMWNINDTVQFAVGASSDLSEEDEEAYKTCKSIFDHDFMNHIGSFANSISYCTDSQEVAVCVCELNAFNVLFNTNSSFEDVASGILEATDNFISENNFARDLQFETSFSDSFKEFISGDGNSFYQKEIKNKGFGDDLVDCLNAFANAKAAATSSLYSSNTHEPEPDEKKNALNNCLDEYTNVVETVSNTSLNHYYKFLLYSDTANYLDNNISVFKENDIEKEKLIGEDSLYVALDDAVTKLKENSSDAEFKKKCDNLNIEGIYRSINATYNPTSSKNV